MWVIITGILASSCSKFGHQNQSKTADRLFETEKIPVYHTWLSAREMVYNAPVHPPAMEIPEHGFFPWAGIVSHHILTHDYMDAWFSRLAEMRKPACFYILSPSHYGISIEPYSLTFGSWESGFGLVKSDINKVEKLVKQLNVNPDSRVFEFEHGVSALMPYLKKYFPDALVVAIAVESETPLNVPMSQTLADILKNEFDEEGRKINFLLISSDFSHHQDLKETKRRDDFSQEYLKNPGGNSWYSVACDNRPGIYVLDRLGKKNLESCILYHTNSWEIAHQDEDDITSYFFVYFADK